MFLFNRLGIQDQNGIEDEEETTNTPGMERKMIDAYGFEMGHVEDTRSFTGRAREALTLNPNESYAAIAKRLGCFHESVRLVGKSMNLPKRRGPGIKRTWKVG